MLTFTRARTLAIFVFGYILGTIQKSMHLFSVMNDTNDKLEKQESATIRNLLQRQVNEEVDIDNIASGWKNIQVFYGNEKHLPVYTDPDYIKQTREVYKLKDGSWAQAQQDNVVSTLLNGKRNGYFIDLAANDAVIISNTYKLETDYGWNGICIEPLSKHWRNLSYRRCHVVAAVVGHNRMEEVSFVEPDDHFLAGIVGDNYDQKPSRVKADAKTLKYYTVPLLEILQRVKAPFVIDYLSLDVEGAELYIMSDFPFQHYSFTILTIERPNNELKEVLKNNGYEYVCSIGDWGETLFILSSARPTLKLENIRPYCV